MMTEISIRTENLGKQYRIGQYVANYRTLRDVLVEGVTSPVRWVAKRREGGPPHRSSDTIWALRHVSFELKQGQVLGVIGRNGAGKSTLLKLLARVTEPTEGMAEIHGRVGSLLEVGTGFHPELTGRENIYLNGAILGMKRMEIERKFDEIVAFAEVEKFIDTPVKRYSSGMYLRLAFAVAAHLEPEILVVDEVLAVGDAEFQRKCLGKMSEVAHEGRTVLFVSHNMSAISRLTKDTIVIDSGHIICSAPTPEAIDFYMTSGITQVGERLWDEPGVGVSQGPFHPIALRVLDHEGRLTNQTFAAEGFVVEFEYILNEDITGLRVGIYLSTSSGEPVFTSFDTDDPKAYERSTFRKRGRRISRCIFPPNFLNEGRFVLGVNASSFRIQSYFTDEHALSFTVDGTGAPGSQWPEKRRGPLRPALVWEISEAVA
jgi:lipopolysaccharide transport system ATP-binding protein